MAIIDIRKIRAKSTIDLQKHRRVHLIFILKRRLQFLAVITFSFFFEFVEH